MAKSHRVISEKQYEKRLRKAERKAAIDKKYGIIPLSSFAPKPKKLAWKCHQQSFGFYEKYLRSDWWKSRREQAKVDAGGKCRRCGAVRFLQVHHLSYRNLWREEREDLEVLCSRCHKQTHDK